MGVRVVQHPQKKLRLTTELPKLLSRMLRWLPSPLHHLQPLQLPYVHHHPHLCVFSDEWVC